MSVGNDMLIQYLMNIMLMNDYKLDQEKQKNVTCFDRDGFILGIILSDISFLNYL